jgi:hypothetical protein
VPSIFIRYIKFEPPSIARKDEVAAGQEKGESSTAAEEMRTGEERRPAGAIAGSGHAINGCSESISNMPVSRQPEEAWIYLILDSLVGLRALIEIFICNHE